MKEPQRPHRRSIRLEGYNYSHPGAYFVTLCAYNRECIFGEIRSEEIHLSPYGMIVYEEWLRSPDLRAEIVLDEFAIMPNHVHGIVFIQQGATGQSPLPMTTGEARSGPVKKSLGAFIGGFKSSVTGRINEMRGLPEIAVWQRNYHEHIIRDDAALHRIRLYIQQNVQRWPLDVHNSDRIGPDEFEEWLHTQGRTPLAKNPNPTQALLP